ncbi:MAG: hypothetical protein ACRC3Z_01050 [Phocaeicola sp.]
MFNKGDKVALFTAITFVFLTLLSFIPEVKVPYVDYTLKRIDLLADIRFKPARVVPPPYFEEEWVATQEVEVDSMKLLATSDTLQLRTPHVKDSIVKQIPQSPIQHASQLDCITFEDYSEDGNSASELASRLVRLKEDTLSNFRIGFLGDSFIEGDILTESLRSQLQKSYGGNGVGFVPISHVASKFRTTILHDFEGWKSHSMLKQNEVEVGKLTFSGFYYTPEEGATVTYRASKESLKQGGFAAVQLLFVNENHAQIHAIVNGSEPRTYAPRSSSQLQTIEIEEDIRSITFSFESVEGLTVYGAYFNNESGIHVDNFSMRGSSGMILSASNSSLCEEWRSYKEYDVLVLQYGLNVISKDMFNYSGYRKSMVSVLQKMKQQFPNTIFIVMGIGDRGTLQDGEVTTMPEVFAMIDTQRKIAKEAKVLFWDTFAAMGGENSMEHFANSSPPLANKDFVHINRAGGRFLAKEFIKSINVELANL